MQYSKRSLYVLDNFGWNPSWQLVEDIRVWALNHIPFIHHHNVEVYANGELLGQQTKVTRPVDAGPISITPWSPAGYGPDKLVWKVEVCMF
jgi:hypothetical protein